MSDAPQAPRKRRPALTARAIVMQQDHVLLLAASDPGRPWFFLPGGHVDHGETLAEACVREVLEETGVNIVIERPLYLREFIAEKHQRRSQHMPSKHHVAALVFLASPDPSHHDLALPPNKIGAFPGDADGSGAVHSMRWVARKDIAQIEIMPPHVARALSGDFPPPASAGIQFWPED